MNSPECLIIDNHVYHSLQSFFRFPTTPTTILLWTHYLDMVRTFRKFISAERSGHWAPYLKAVRVMLPYLASSGHNIYTKSLVLHLQDMKRIDITEPQL